MCDVIENSKTFMQEHTFLLCCIALLAWLIYMLVKRRDRLWEFVAVFLATGFGVYCAFLLNERGKQQTMDLTTITRANLMYLESHYNAEDGNTIYNSYSKSKPLSICVDRLDDVSARALLQDGNIFELLAPHQVSLIHGYVDSINTVNATNEIYINHLGTVGYDCTDDGEKIRKALKANCARFLAVCGRLQKEFEHFCDVKDYDREQIKKMNITIEEETKKILEQGIQLTK